MVGCKAKEKDVIGIWRRETLYMAYYGCETDMIATFSDDGTFEFGFSFDGDEFLDIGYTFKAQAGTWTGAKLAIAALNDENVSGEGYCDFEYLHVE